MNTTGIIGHTHQINRLDSMIRKKMIPQTVLFAGKSGIGKKTTALRFIKYLFCKSENRPCLTCPSCQQIAGGSFPDQLFLQPNEKGTIPIGKNDEPGTVRWLIERLSKKSISGNYGVIIDGVDKISIAGQNALLKTIEEPATGTHIILITANKSNILSTILSRSSIIPFNPLSTDQIISIMSDLNPQLRNLNLISGISGGSVETAMILSDEEILHEILLMCESISSFLVKRGALNLNFTSIQKKIGTETTVEIITDIYRKLLIGAINHTECEPELNKIKINDIVILKKLIKILLALRKGYSHNLNIKNSLKAMLYSIDKIDENNMSELNFIS